MSRVPVSKLSSDAKPYVPAPENWQVVISHGPSCTDGITAAWCYWRCLPSEMRSKLQKYKGFLCTSRNEFRPNTLFNAIKCQEEGAPIVFCFVNPSAVIPLDFIKGKNVLILDLHLGNSILSIAEHSNKTLLIDHHEGPRFEHPKLTNIIDYKVSAAELAWKYFCPDTPLPMLVKIVSMADTWDWSPYPDIKYQHMMAGMRDANIFSNFYRLEEAYKDWNENIIKYQKTGKHLFNCEQKNAWKIAQNGDIGYLIANGIEYKIIYTQAAILHSLVGSMLRKVTDHSDDAHFTLTWKYDSKRQMIRCSLRDPLPGIDLSSIARYFNGGGHAKSACFSFPGMHNFEKYISPGPRMMVSS